MNSLWYFSFLIKWKKKDDILLRFAILKYGKSNWYKITNVFFFQKEGIQNCRFRWFNWLISDIKKINWTKIEDQKLILLKRKFFFGYWKFLIVFLKRTPIQCLFRFFTIQKIFIKFKCKRNKKICSKNISVLEKRKLSPTPKKNRIFHFRKMLRKKAHLNPLGNFFMGRIRAINWIGKKHIRLGFFRKMTQDKQFVFLNGFSNLTKIKKNKANKKKIKQNFSFFSLLFLLDLYKKKKIISKRDYLNVLYVLPYFFFSENYF